MLWAVSRTLLGKGKKKGGTSAMALKMSKTDEQLASMAVDLFFSQSDSASDNPSPYDIEILAPDDGLDWPFTLGELEWALHKGGRRSEAVGSKSGSDGNLLNRLEHPVSATHRAREGGLGDAPSKSRLRYEDRDSAWDINPQVRHPSAEHPPTNHEEVFDDVKEDVKDGVKNVRLRQLQLPALPSLRNRSLRISDYRFSHWRYVTSTTRP
ncbi:hypothetical protein HPB47_009699 [Ixodes persulcatus]|uniref:Uncharacterized protein n=1 Tax=Ixodes persulcatus TaxID=34615 RepID=A0AC60P1F9_IXOPE|nr:hypothetical protein HPB47_009699 [Ixodes persulcatus]